MVSTLNRIVSFSIVLMLVAMYIPLGASADEIDDLQQQSQQLQAAIEDNNEKVRELS